MEDITTTELLVAPTDTQKEVKVNKPSNKQLEDVRGLSEKMFPFATRKALVDVLRATYRDSDRNEKAVLDLQYETDRKIVDELEKAGIEKEIRDRITEQMLRQRLAHTSRHNLTIPPENEK